MTTLTAIVESIGLQGRRNLAVTLISATGEPLPVWQPGAHIDLHLAPGLIRPYSLTGDSRDRERYHICVARDHASRGGSRYIHEQLRPGQQLTLSMPRNHFPLHPAPRVILVAGGIGITPLYAMALHLEQQATPFSLHYYCQHAEDTAYRHSLSAGWKAGDVHLWSSANGVSPRQHIAPELQTPHSETLIYLCGPAEFMQHQKQQILAYGWPESAIYTEAFKPTVASAQVLSDDTFTIELASSGQQWRVPAEKSIAQVLIENGVDIPLSCEMGMCGACLTPVCAGEVDHRDTVQSESEKGAAPQQIALCCSRSFSEVLILDL